MPKLHHQYTGEGGWATRHPEGVTSQSVPILPTPPPKRLARIPKPPPKRHAGSGLGVGEKRADGDALFGLDRTPRTDTARDHSLKDLDRLEPH